MNEIPKQILKKIISKYGRNIVNDPKRCEGLLKDYCPNDKLEVNVLVLSLKEKIPIELINDAKRSPQEILFARLKQKLCDNIGMNSDVAKWAVDSWVEALEIEPPKLTKFVGCQEIAGDGRFVAYDNGIVIDTKTNLIWASKDHGNKITWHEAKKYCEEYNGGGYTDWQMPTIDELEGLYDNSKNYKTSQSINFNIHLTELIQLSNICHWALETRSGNTFFNFQISNEAVFFNFASGVRDWCNQTLPLYASVLPVRIGKYII